MILLCQKGYKEMSLANIGCKHRPKMGNDALVLTRDSGVNGKPVYRISFHLGRNDEIRKEITIYRVSTSN